jgi:N-hydroxyarylamine O-acetyltransferase
MNLDAYLARIGYEGDRTPTLENLQAMHRAHFYSVPFENIDIHLGRRLEIDEDHIFDKVVRQKRGGWCHELNGLWGRALRQLGYTVDILGARVMKPAGQLSIPHSHTSMLVHLSEDWLSDVGFGSRFAGPLRMAERAVQEIEGRKYAVANDGDHWFVSNTEPGVAFAQLVFTLDPQTFENAREACEWQQSSPESNFTQQSLATLPNPRGRVTLAGLKLMTIVDGERIERVLGSRAEADAVLEEHLGIALEGHTWRTTENA